MTLRSRLRPRHVLLVAVFLIGPATPAFRVDVPVGGVASEILAFLIEGLLAAVVFQYTVGILWRYVAGYRDAGGGWTDAPFLLPLAVGVGAFAVVVAATGRVASAAGVGFWGFVLATAVVAAGVQVVVGYREGRGGAV